jgi:hypothetical protein
MSARRVRLTLWMVLCVALLWSIAQPSLHLLAVTHPRTIGISALAMLCGTRALFGAPSRAWEVAFLVLAILPAVLFGVNNFLLERKFGFAEFGTILVLAIAVYRLWGPDTRALLDGSFRDAAKLILVNAVLLLGLLVVSEGMTRLFFSDFDPARRTDNQYGNPFWFKFQPYLMFSTDGPVDMRFRNARRPGDPEFGHFATNNMGFRMTEPVQFDRPRPKAAGERVVLFTGGSGAWGAGATSNETTIAARLQAILNESQSTYRYVVISLSSNGWIAFQSMLALTLYGLNFDPDWAIAMDGHNDVLAACTFGGGAGRDGFSRQFGLYFQSYLYHNPSPPFYRGAWENELIRVSVLYRILSQERYVPPPHEPIATWDEVERALAFYELTYDRLFRVLAASKVKMLLSSQPYKDLYKADFDVGPDQLRDMARRHAGADCQSVPAREMFRYSLPRLQQVSQDLVTRWRDRLDVRYLNMNDFLPEDPQERPDLFWGISTSHLVDRGQDLIANAYARVILDSDLPDRKH